MRLGYKKVNAVQEETIDDFFLVVVAEDASKVVEFEQLVELSLNDFPLSKEKRRLIKAKLMSVLKKHPKTTIER